MVIVTIDAVVFQKRNETREIKYEESENFEIDILGEGDPEKSLTVPEKHMLNNPGRIYMR